MAATAATLSEQAQELQGTMAFFQLGRGSSAEDEAQLLDSPLYPTEPRRREPAHTGNGLVTDDIAMKDFKKY